MKSRVKATGKDKDLQDKLLLSGPIPEHIAIIMDGNGRWAKKKGLPRIAGHREGVNSVRDIVEVCGQLGVKYLTLYAFSTENWKRPKEEVSLLMRLLLSAIRDEKDRLHSNGVILKTIGEISELPNAIQDELIDAIEITKNNDGLTLILALSYSGRWDLTNAVKEISKKVSEGTISADSITEETIKNSLSTKKYPDPDLLVRTSGELRVSNFLLWQIAYSEIYITQLHWPDFRRNALYESIDSFQKRERRFGLISEQVKKNGKEKQSLVSKIFKRVSNH
ncbi:MAG: isoprenyl transferase [Ignavibacteria bacterium]|nr:isoprenyl transferase [Bacteroidota bacterium]MSQ46434.1 isoprenyl transferase [Ignavibacteria bacterium]